VATGAIAGETFADSAGSAGVEPRLSLGIVAIVAAGMLVYVSGSFMFAEIIGIKRYLQIFLVLLLLAAAAVYGLRLPLRRVDSLLLFVIAMIGTELLMRGKMLYVLEGFSTLLALIVVYSVPASTFWHGARALVWMATAFAVMALVQWVILFYMPELGQFRIFIDDEGVILNSVKHPIMYLGLFGEQQFTFLGRAVARLQSFALEPSLNVVYFMLPASLAMLINRRGYFVAGCVVLLFCGFSLSGSVFLSVVFMVLWFPLLAFVPLRYAFSYGLMLWLIAYLIAIQRIGLETMVGGLAFLSRFGDFFGKSTSLTVRGLAATDNLGVALSAPLGSSTLADMAGPWPINGALAAGWIGAVFIFLYLYKLGRNIEVLNAGYGLFTRTRLGTLVLLGAMSTIVAFNDYQMSNYAGVVLLAFIGRAIVTRNEAESATADIQPEPTRISS
jgi:hypothetical protein